MKHIASWLGGSHMYNLNTPQSDMDMRGVYLSEDTSSIIGLNKWDQNNIKNKSEDREEYEFRYYIKQLSEGVLAMLEPLWNPSSVHAHGPEWRALVQYREELFNGKQISSKIGGFLRSQYQLVFDDIRKADAGSIRAEAIAKYGYYPKGAMHVMRLHETGTTYLRTGEYRIAPIESRDLCLSIKTEPRKYDPIQIREMIDNASADFDVAYAETQIKFSEFNFDLANDIILRAYSPILLQKSIRSLSA